MAEITYACRWGRVSQYFKHEFAQNKDDEELDDIYHLSSTMKFAWEPFIFYKKCIVFWINTFK